MLPIGGVLYLSTLETAQILGVSDSRVRQLVMDRTLKPKRIGPRIYFHPDKVEQYRLELEAMRARPKKRRSSYVPKKTPASKHLDYQSPAEKQAMRQARLVRTRVA